MKYYIDQNLGADGNSGTSEEPWRTLDRANRHDWQVGESIHLRGGQLHRGSLILQNVEGLAITSYGEGRAVIAPSSDASGLLVRNSRGISISEISVLGAGAEKTRTHGICVFSDAVDSGEISIRNVDISGFGLAGVALGGGSGQGLKSVLLENLLSTQNGYAGIFAWSDGLLSPHSRIVIRDCTVSENAGIPGLLHPNKKGIHSGHGILLSGASDSIIEKCRAIENGRMNVANHCGPAGIWASHSQRVIIRNCDAIRNHTAGAADGGGFGLDGGVTDSVLENNFSQENDGPGFLLARYYGASASSGNRVIGNRSVNDARKNDNGAIHVWAATGFPIEDTLISKNQIFLNERGAGRARAIKIEGHIKNMIVTENRFSVSRAAYLVDVDSEYDRLVFDRNTFDGNLGPILWCGEVSEEVSGWQKLLPEIHAHQLRTV